MGVWGDSDNPLAVNKLMRLLARPPLSTNDAQVRQHKLLMQVSSKRQATARYLHSNGNNSSCLLPKRPVTTEHIPNECIKIPIQMGLRAAG